MDPRAYWLWLQHAFAPGSSKPRSIYNRFDSLEEFYRGGLPVWSRLRFISETDLTSLSSYSLSQAEATLEYCEKMNQQIITPEDEEYPDLLWNIPDPPAVLYLRGRMPRIDDSLSIGVVGSRKTSDLVLKTAEKLSYELSKSGAIVVSGGAIGVDTAAHRGAMMGSSPTIAVLGCGLDYPYLMENELLRQKIVAKGGALVTEYPPAMGVQRGTFQIRNRIISGLSRGVVIVSAEKKSGTMITARRATEQNRDLFAVPGNPMLPTSEGPNGLIKDGAVPVTCGYDIIEHYSGSGVSGCTWEEPQQTLYTQSEQKTDGKRAGENAQDHNTRKLPELSLNSKAVYRFLREEPVHISELSLYTALTPSQILTAMTELELLDLAQAYSGQRYALKK